MKKSILLQFVLMLFVAGNIQAAANLALPEDVKNQPEISEIISETGQSDVEAFLNLTPSKYKEMTGEKMGLKKTIALKAAQKAVKKQMSGKSAAGAKSQLVALILVVFVGVLGIHRFYLGYTVIGIIQLLTAGGCGIWALIDLIRIITGELKPADGSEYNPTL
ncbi:MAG TPA: TM2 domain-containing protein [Saprospiraceae bacterium]|jgi:TM2 domain-containing membrane protein YozV|nr:TM2 domain-containing protein [Saprospiraceae bacterium]HRJ14951.1 TM2 domain-containing protein [Saprospiraceae bacterium]